MSYPTWSDLNSPSIVPPLGARQAHDIGPAALMVSTEPDLRYIRSNSGKLASTPFFNGSLFTHEDKAQHFCVAGPYIGAPYAVMLLESLIAKGARKIIVLGWCGAITKELSPGDLVVVKKSFIDEGTSHHYMHIKDDPPSSHPDSTLTQNLVSHLEKSGQTPNLCTIWTTDAIYRETPEKVEWYNGIGANAVEMECSALFSVASYRKVSIAALLVVSDSLAKKNGDWEPGFRTKQFKTMRRVACESAVTMTRKIANGV